MPRTTSNLTNTELRRIFEVDEKSPLYEHIKQTTNAYLSTYQGGRSWGSIRGDIKRQIILIWKDFADKYGPNRSDMNEIKERAQTDNYNLTQRGLTSQFYGASGALEREILRWNREECDKLINILEYEGRGGGIKHKKRKHKSKKKRSKKKRSKKKKSKKIKNKRTKNKRMRGSGTAPTDFGKTTRRRRDNLRPAGSGEGIPDEVFCAKIKGKWYAYPDSSGDLTCYNSATGKYEVNEDDVTDPKANTELKIGSC